jgi:hypothetical protein
LTDSGAVEITGFNRPIARNPVSRYVIAMTSAAISQEPTHGDCANCGAALAGPFCAQCGQSAEALKRPVWEFIEHTLEVLLDFDTRGLKTVRALLKPGEITAQYLAGHRARFVPPVRLYILVSLLFFLAIWATNTAIVQFYDARGMAGVPVNGPGLGTKLLSPLDPKLTVGAAAAAEKIHVFDVDGHAPGWAQRVSAGLQRGAAEPKLLNEHLSDLFPKTMFAFVPFFALLSRLLYLRRGRYLVEHVVFALHFHTFAFLLLTALILLRPILPGGFAVWMFLLPAGAYLLIAMRRVFGGSWLGNLWRELVLLLLYDIVFTMGMILVVGLSLSEL